MAEKYLKLNDIDALLKDEEYVHIFEELQKLPEAINRLIKYTNLKLAK